MTVFGSVGAWMFYIVIGNYAFYLDVNDLLDVTGLVAADPAGAIAEIIGSLAWSKPALIIFSALSIIFVATTYDSASYVLASAASKDLQAGQNPGRGHRLFWAAVTGMMPVALMFMAGELKTITSMVLVASLPILLVSGLVIWSLVKEVNAISQQDN